MIGTSVDGAAASARAAAAPGAPSAPDAAVTTAAVRWRAFVH